MISKFQVGLKCLLRQGLSEPNFYGDLVYRLKKIVSSNNFSAQFIQIISHYKKIGYDSNVLQQTACLVVNPITVGNFAFLFNLTPVGWTSDSMKVPTLRIVYWWDVGAWCFGCLSGPPGFTCRISFALVFSIFTVESFYLLYLLVILWFTCICFRRWCINEFGVFHANQISMCLDPHLN